MRYTDDLFLKLIHMVNEQLPDVEAMYIVDSFGEMREKDVRRFLYLLDTNLDEHIKIGFHGHNNLQLAYANAMSVIAFGGRHELIIDSSILGMGKGAGNLNTELLMDYANRAMGKSYEIQPIFYAMDQVIDIIRNDYRWGYSAEYFITSAEHCTPTYARYYKETYNLSVGQIYELVHKIEPIKKKSFDKNYAKHLYFANYGKEFNDSEAIERLKRSILDKRLLLIAPGKSLSWHTEEIETLLMEDDIFSISINNEIFASKYTFITREDMVKKLDASRRYILPDNLHTVEHTMANVLVISYYKWFWNGTEFLNSAGVAVLDLVKELGAKTVILAGYDGFSVDMNENYSKISLRRSIRPEQIKAYNELMQERLTNEWKGMEITFLAGKEIVFKELQ